MAQATGSIKERLDEIQRRHQEQLRAEINKIMQPARERLQEIAELRAKLDREERELLDILGEGKGPGRRRKGKRVTAFHKKEIIGRFISDGHIKDNSELTKELRTALTDEGFGIHDFRKMNDYLPAGWQAKSNGLRGTAARTTFHKVG